MDRSKIVSIIIALACVAGLIALSVYGAKLDPVTNGTAHGVLAAILWQVKPAIGGSLPVPPAPTLLLTFALVCPVVGAPYALGCAGSTPASQLPARDYARAGVMMVAEGVKVADDACATVAKAKSDAGLAKTCADAYDTARASLTGAMALVDAWDSADQKSYVCTVGHAVSALSSMASAVTTAGGPALPAIVQDALSFGGQLSKGCAS